MKGDSLEKENVCLTEEELYNLMKSFNGYGNPKAKIWLIGQEENWGKDFSFDLEKEQYEYYSNKLTSFKDDYVANTFKKRINCSGNTFEKGIVKIVSHFENLDINNIDIEEILKKVYVINYNFIPITLKSKNDIYKKFNKTKEEFNLDLTNRFAELIRMAKNNNVEKIFILNRTYFYEIARIIIANDVLINWDEGCVTYDGMKIYYSYHPSYHGFNNRFYKIKNKG